MLGEPCLQRLQPPASAADPVCQGRAIDLDTLPGEDLALPVKRQVIAVFGNQDMREKTGSGEALGDRTLRGGRLVDGPAGPAAIAGPADADDPKPRRHVVQHLADGLADGMKLATAAGAGLLIEIDPHVFTGQMRRQAWPIGPRAPTLPDLWPLQRQHRCLAPSSDSNLERYCRGPFETKRSLRRRLHRRWSEVSGLPVQQPGPEWRRCSLRRLQQLSPILSSRP